MSARPLKSSMMTTEDSEAAPLTRSHSSSNNQATFDNNNNNHHNKISTSPGKTANKQTAPPINFKLLLLILMVLQNSSTVLVGRYTRSSVPKDELFEVNHLILVVELGKFILSCALEFYTTKGALILSFQRHVVQKPMDCLKITIPALLYLVQNTLLYIALSNLTAPIFQVTYQAKLVTTALVSVLLLKRSYNMRQWICLVFLSLGVAIVVLGEQKPKEKKEEDNDDKKQNLFLGLVSVSIACFSSALAGVYFEMVLKKPADKSSDEKKTPPASLWMRNIQLSFFSMVIAICQGVFNSSSSSSESDAAGTANAVVKPYLHGFTFWTWVLVGLQAGGGLLVAAVIKYADNVLKGLATGVSVVFATALSRILFDTQLTGQFSFGAVLILASVFYFSNPLPERLSVMRGRESRKSLLPK